MVIEDRRDFRIGSDLITFDLFKRRFEVGSLKAATGGRDLVVLRDRRSRLWLFAAAASKCCLQPPGFFGERQNRELISAGFGNGIFQELVRSAC